MISQGTASQRLLYALQTVHALKLAGERSASLVPCQLMARIATLALTMRRALAPGPQLRENDCRDTAADLKKSQRRLKLYKVLETKQIPNDPSYPSANCCNMRLSCCGVHLRQASPEPSEHVYGRHWASSSKKKPAVKQNSRSRATWWMSKQVSSILCKPPECHS